jgi:hypothetical protein
MNGGVSQYHIPATMMPIVANSGVSSGYFSQHSVPSLKPLTTTGHQSTYIEERSAS